MARLVFLVCQNTADSRVEVGKPLTACEGITATLEENNRGQDEIGWFTTMNRAPVNCRPSSKPGTQEDNTEWESVPKNANTDYPVQKQVHSFTELSSSALALSLQKNGYISTLFKILGSSFILLVLDVIFFTSAGYCGWVAGGWVVLLCLKV